MVRETVSALMTPDDHQVFRKNSPKEDVGCQSCSTQIFTPQASPGKTMPPTLDVGHVTFSGQEDIKDVIQGLESVCADWLVPSTSCL